MAQRGRPTQASQIQRLAQEEGKYISPRQAQRLAEQRRQLIRENNKIRKQMTKEFLIKETAREVNRLQGYEKSVAEYKLGLLKKNKVSLGDMEKMVSQFRQEEQLKVTKKFSSRIGEKTFRELKAEIASLKKRTRKGGRQYVNLLNRQHLENYISALLNNYERLSRVDEEGVVDEVIEFFQSMSLRRFTTLHESGQIPTIQDIYDALQEGNVMRLLASLLKYRRKRR
jgi:hypothetical protein